MLANLTLDTVIDHLPTIAHGEDGPTTLIAMLAEDSAHFDGLSVQEADWLRAHIYAAVALSNTPETCLAAAREDLQTSSSPFVLAGIARVLKAAKAGIEWTSDLEAARLRIEYSDVFPEFLFDLPESPCCRHLTCIQEIEAALGGLTQSVGANANLCTTEAADFLGRPAPNLLTAVLQDQAGEEISLDRLLKSTPLVLALFYTRCMNPLKCSLTISRLSECACAEPRLGYLGITYDPDYDTPRRLKVYGEDRLFPFSDTARIVRWRDDWNTFKHCLKLRAGYGVATVNTHAREIFLITKDRGVWRLPPDWLRDVRKIFELAAEGSQG